MALVNSMDINDKTIRKIAIAALVSILIRIILFFVIYKGSLVLNLDDEGVFRIAENYIDGHGYTILKNGVYKPSAFHASTPVFIYKWLIESGISKDTWSFSICIISLILFFVSTFYFYCLCAKFINDRMAFFSTLTYVFYPSVLVYIGTCITYENFVMPMMVINVYILVDSYQKNKMSVFNFVLLLILVCISCIFKSNVLAVYVVLILTYIFLSLFYKRYALATALVVVGVVLSIVHVPAFIKNKLLFGEYILSTQSGFELLQGHNPTARGSWMGDWVEKSSPIYIYAHNKIANIDSLDEYQESVARKNLAIQWIKSNPIQELKLLIRKSIIYFIPQNLEVVQTSNIYNPINLSVHVLFISMILYLIFNNKISGEDCLMIAPFIGSFAVTLLYFVGYRWRFYAEPFMILYAWRMVEILKRYYKTKKQTTQLK